MTAAFPGSGPAFAPHTDTGPAFVPHTDAGPAFVPHTDAGPAFVPLTGAASAFVPLTGDGPALASLTGAAQAFGPFTGAAPAFAPLSAAALGWPRLRPGDRVRMLSPASYPEEAGWRERATEHFRGWGLHVDFGRHADDRHGYLAGRDDDRRADLEEAFRDPEVRAIVATRGGAGAYRIAARIDPALVRADPKPIVGFSDITYLHLALLGTTGLVGVHGWMGAEGCRRLLFTDEPAILQADPAAPSARLTIPGVATGTKPGVATGRLVGGNVNALAGMIGAGLPSLAGAVLCLEGEHEPGYDQVVWQLERSGLLAGVRGVAIGYIEGAEPGLRQRLSGLGVPVLGGLPFGHMDRQVCMPIGTTATIDTTAGTLTVESGVSR